MSSQVWCLVFWTGRESDWFLVPSRFFYQFLLGNERATAKEIKDEYVETLSKIYLSYYRSYLGRLMKVQVRPRWKRHSWAPGLAGGTVAGRGERCKNKLFIMLWEEAITSSFLFSLV